MASEKEKMSHVNVAEAPSNTSSIKDKHIVASEAAGFDLQRTKNLLWKLDRNIVPFLALLYL